MGVPASVTDAYNAQRDAADSLANNVRQTLRAFTDKNRYGLVSRLKSLESLSEKLETGRYESWSSLDDRVAFTLVIPTTAHEASVIDFLDSIYDRGSNIRLRNSSQKAPDVFRFDTTRYIGRLRLQEGLDLPADVDRILFEVQIQTAFEYAWTVVTHDVVYKSQDVDWRKLRLAAQLKAAVEQIEFLVTSFTSNLDALPASEYPEVDTKAAIIERFRGFVKAGALSSELVPESWSRFADNVWRLVASYSRRYDVPGNTIALLGAVEGRLADASWIPPVSGSLFQLVVGEVSREPTRGASLEQYVVVPSQELGELHGVTKIPRPFRFD